MLEFREGIFGFSGPLLCPLFCGLLWGSYDAGNPAYANGPLTGYQIKEKNGTEPQLQIAGTSQEPST